MSLHPDWLLPDWQAPGAGALMTTRLGGASAAPFDSFNLGAAVGDDPASVAANRASLALAIGARPVFLKQVHGARVVRLSIADAQAGANKFVIAQITFLDEARDQLTAAR